MQGGTGAPEQGGDGQRDLAQLVAPQDVDAVGKVGDQLDRVARLVLVARAGVRDIFVEDGGQAVGGDHHAQGRFDRGVDAGVNHRQVEAKQEGAGGLADQDAAHDGAEDDRHDGQAFDPAVGRDQLFRRQQFGQDAVLGRRVDGSAKADHGIGQ